MLISLSLVLWKVKRNLGEEISGILCNFILDLGNASVFKIMTRVNDTQKIAGQSPGRFIGRGHCPVPAVSCRF